MKIKRMVNGTEMEFELTKSEIQEILQYKIMADILDLHRFIGDDTTSDLTDDDLKCITTEVTDMLERNDEYCEIYELTIEEAIENYITNRRI